MPKPTAAANATALPDVTRRSLLKAAGALGTVAALAVPVAVLPKVEAAEHPDAELLRLGAEWERNISLWQAERARNSGIYDAWKIEYAKWRAINPGAPIEDFLPHPATKAHDAAIDRENVFFDAADNAAERIRATPAQTLQGLAVKARLAADDCDRALCVAAPHLVEDWQRDQIFSFFREVERLAMEATHV